MDQEGQTRSQHREEDTGDVGPGREGPGKVDQGGQVEWESCQWGQTQRPRR